MHFKGIKFQRPLRFGYKPRRFVETLLMIQNLIVFPVDTRSRFNVCVTSHRRRMEVETTSYVCRIKVKHRL